MEVRDYGERGEVGHEGDCLHVMAREALCRCARRDWLDEEVPRREARREVLESWATWAHEQRVFTEADAGSLHGPFGAKPPKWVQDALKVGASLTSKVYVDVRLKALAMLNELGKPEPKSAGTAETENPPNAATPVESAAHAEPTAETIDDVRLNGRKVLTVATQGTLL